MNAAIIAACSRERLFFVEKNRLVSRSGGRTRNVSRDNENVLVRQARHVPSQGPARYRSAARLPLRSVSYLEHTNEDWIRYQLNDVWSKCSLKYL